MARQGNGRGSTLRPPNRFERMHVEPVEESGGAVSTEFFVDRTRSILSRNDSPDLPFTYSINPYRGCEHGCIYCYARQTHEYLGFSSGMDFETKIMVKPDAPDLLERAFRRRSWRPQPVALSGNTDCYQPVERRLKLTRRCLQVFLKYRNPVSMITKSDLVTRDRDVLEELARMNLVSVRFSITTLDPHLAGTMEPRASTPWRRLKAMRCLSDAGVPVGVSVAPVIPGLTENEIPSILREGAAAGARSAVYLLVRLPYSVEDLFIEWLGRQMPLRKSKIINRIKEVRGGSLNCADFAARGRGEGRFAESIAALFEMSCRKYGLNKEEAELSTRHFRREPGPQLRLF